MSYDVHTTQPDFTLAEMIDTAKGVNKALAGIYEVRVSGSDDSTIQVSVGYLPGDKVGDNEYNRWVGITRDMNGGSFNTCLRGDYGDRDLTELAYSVMGVYAYALEDGEGGADIADLVEELINRNEEK